MELTFAHALWDRRLVVPDAHLQRMGFEPRPLDFQFDERSSVREQVTAGEFVHSELERTV
jgi:hypothetical protein